MAKMRYFLVGFAHEKGFGRKFFGTTDQINDEKIMSWEKTCQTSSRTKNVCILSISEIEKVSPK